MIVSTVEAKEPELIKFPEAMRRLMIGRPALSRLVAEGKLTVYAVPGSHPRLRADEIQRLIEASTRQAVPTTSTQENRPEAAEGKVPVKRGKNGPAKTSLS